MRYNGQNIYYIFDIKRYVYSFHNEFFYLTYLDTTFFSVVIIPHSNITSVDITNANKAFKSIMRLKSACICVFFQDVEEFAEHLDFKYDNLLMFAIRYRGEYNS